MSLPYEPKTGLGLAQLKTEGAAIAYDPGAGPGKPLTRWGHRARLARAVLRRLRWLPTRLAWAIFGDEYY
jgi:hypothetical protein